VLSVRKRNPSHASIIAKLACMAKTLNAKSADMRHIEYEMLV
jgi:hypothetical protein